MGRVVFPFRFIAIGIDHARAVAVRVVAISRGVPVAISSAQQLVGGVEDAGFGRCARRAVPVCCRSAHAITRKVLNAHIAGRMIGRLCMKRCVFEACCAFHWVGLRDHLVRAVVFDGGFTTPSVDEFCHPMRPVVFELPAKSRFAGLSNALEVPAFIRVFDHVFHRVFGAFHETFGVIRQFDLAARRVSDRFEVPTPIVGKRRRVAVAIRYTFQSPRGTAELVYRLIFKRKGIAGSFARH